MQLFKLRNIILYFIYFYFIFLNNLLAETLNESGANVFMYHRFDESKYPSTNINTNQQFLGYIFLARLKCCLANISVGAIRAT